MRIGKRSGEALPVLRNPAWFYCVHCPIRSTTDSKYKLEMIKRSMEKYRSVGSECSIVLTLWTARRKWSYYREKGETRFSLTWFKRFSKLYRGFKLVRWTVGPILFGPEVHSGDIRSDGHRMNTMVKTVSAVWLNTAMEIRCLNGYRLFGDLIRWTGIGNRRKFVKKTDRKIKWKIK